MPASASALLANYVEFLRTHRGTIAATPLGLAVRSARPEFTFAIHGRGDSPDAAAVAAEWSTVLVTPESPLAAGDLARVGMQPAGGLTVMTLPAAEALGWPTRTDVAIARAATADAMSAFSAVQARAFLESDAGYAEWHPFLDAANRANLRNAAQSFYVGTDAGAPAGVALALESPGLVGLYAVATLPGRRKSGLSTAIMQRAIADAHARGTTLVTLQVATGSYAESFYKKLGFATAFTLSKFAKVSPS